MTETARARVTFDWPIDNNQFIERTRRLPWEATQVATFYPDNTHITAEYEWPIT